MVALKVSTGQAAYPVEEQVTEVLLASATPPHDAGGGVVDGAVGARSHCRFAPPTHPLNTIIATIFGTSFSERTSAAEP